MYLNIDWEVRINDRRLAMIESAEIRKSVDLLADICDIVLPGAAYGKSRQIEQQVKRGDKVTVKLGYNRDRQPENFRTEFEGYLLRISTDNDSLTFHCEDAMFLFRVMVSNKQFKAKTVKEIAEYLVQQLKLTIEVNCTLGVVYDTFIISNAYAYDVLHKLQEETGANIYMKWLEDKKQWQLNIHPPYTEPHGKVVYSFQQNIETSDLKYVQADEKHVEVIIRTTGNNGKLHEERYGTSGGQQQEKFTVYGMSKESMQELAKQKHRLLTTSGYEGSITGWWIPYVEPGYTAIVKDKDYEYKDGAYYVTSVTTICSAAGGSRQVQLGIKVGENPTGF